MPRSQGARSEPSRLTWRQFARRLTLAFILFLFMSLSLPLPGSFVFALVPVTLLVWGGLLALVAATNLFEGRRSMRLVWAGLTAGAYMAVAVIALTKGTPGMVDMIGLVVALTLVPHLGRSDLGVAMRDWAVVIGIALYVGLGVQAMWVLVSSLGLPVFFIVALGPPLLFEALMLLSRRSSWQAVRGYIAPLLLATITSVVLLSLTQFNTSMLPGWFLFFGVIIGVLIGAGLLLSYLTRHMAEVASGAQGGTNPIARALVELSHGPLIISLALYLPISLLR